MNNMPQNYVVEMVKSQKFMDQKAAIKMAISTAKKAGGIVTVYKIVDGQRVKIYECEDVGA